MAINLAQQLRKHILNLRNKKDFIFRHIFKNKSDWVKKLFILSTLTTWIFSYWIREIRRYYYPAYTSDLCITYTLWTSYTVHVLHGIKRDQRANSWDIFVVVILLSLSLSMRLRKKFILRCNSRILTKMNTQTQHMRIRL